MSSQHKPFEVPILFIIFSVFCIIPLSPNLILCIKAFYNKILLELEKTKTELEAANNEIEDKKTQLSNTKDIIDRVKEEATDKINQLNHSYSVLYSEHEALKATIQTSDNENSI